MWPPVLVTARAAAEPTIEEEGRGNALISKSAAGAHRHAIEYVTQLSTRDQLDLVLHCQL
jgi:hypothetical protein